MPNPRLRFKDVNNEYPDWNSVKLSDVLFEYKEQCEKGGAYEHVSLTKEGVVPKSDRYDRDFLVTTESKKYRVTHYNDICYNPANLKFGVICRNDYGDAIFSPIYITFKISDGYIPEFIEALVTTEKFINRALRYQQGTVYERMAVSPEDLVSLEVNIPCIEEQKKIAEFLESIDDVIKKSEQEIEYLETEKKYAMRQIFSQQVKFKKMDGEEFPDWEEVNFWDAVSLNSSLVDPTKEPYKHMLHVGAANIEKNTGVLRECITAEEEGITSGKYLFDEKCVVYSKIRPELSKATIPGFVGLCSADAYPLKPRDGILPEIILAQLLSTDFVNFATSTSARTKMPKINQEELGQYVFSIPCLEEQKLIASLILDFDKALSVAKNELKYWKDLKKGLIQQMFV